MNADPFVPWNAEHLLVLALTFAAPVAVGMWARRDSSGRRGRLTAGVIAAALVAQLLGNLVLVAVPLNQRWQEFMPLHLCHLALFVCVAACLTRKPRWFAIAYFWGLGGTLQGLLTPELGWGFPSRECIFFFAGHSGIVGCVLFLIVAFRLRPTWKSVGAAYGWIAIYGVVAGVFNAAFDTNYGYLCAKPTTPSLLDHLGPWPWYLASLGVLAGVVFVLLYLPWAVKDRVRRTSATATPRS